MARRQQLVTVYVTVATVARVRGRAINNPHMHSIKRRTYDSIQDGTVSICYISDVAQGVSDRKAFLCDTK